VLAELLGDLEQALGPQAEEKGLTLAVEIGAGVPSTIVTDTQPHPQVKLPPDVPKIQPVYAQLLSTENQKTAEALAAKLIDGGFTGAYVERSGNAFKVRVRFPSEPEARANEAKLRAFSKDVWIVK